MDEINLDVDSIKSVLSTDFYGEVKDNVSSYTEEWLTQNCIGTVFEFVTKEKEQITQNIQTMLSHVSEIESISQQRVNASLFGLTNGIIALESNQSSNTNNNIVSHQNAVVNTGTDQRLNVRIGSDANSQIISTISSGTKVEILESDSETGRTKIKLEDGTVGYVSSSSLQIGE